MILQIYTIIQTLISLIAIFTGIVSISLLCDPLPLFSGGVGVFREFCRHEVPSPFRFR